MPELIIDGKIQQDDWHYLARTESPDCQQIPDGKVMVPLSTWLAQSEQLTLRPATETGIWLDSDEEPEDLGNPDRYTVIAINFPKFADGRGYSIARLLRERFSFTGELRAMGDVLMDQLFYMKRCGFNSFALRADRSAKQALAGLSAFTEVYQAATDEPLPLFRRRKTNDNSGRDN
jgi:uncharacterized protein (DUF934 family)